MVKLITLPEIGVHTERYALPFGNKKIIVEQTTPDEPRYKTPALVTHGFASDMRNHQEVTHSLGRVGHRVVNFSIEEGKGRRQSPGDVIKERAEATLIVAESTGERKVHLVPNSLSTLASVEAATQDPNKIDKLVITSGPGMSSKTSTPLLPLRGLRKTPPHIAHDRIPESSVNGFQAVTYSLTHPRKAWQELDRVAHADIEDSLRGLQESGIDISIIHGDQDVLFDAQEVVATARRAGIPDSHIHIIHGAGHEAIATSSQFIRRVHQVLKS